MFTNLTWSAFFLLLLVSTFIYLIVVGWLYYRNDLARLFRQKKLMSIPVTPSTVKPGDPLPIVHELVSELSVVIRAAAEGHTIHAELFFSLQHVIKHYLILAGSEFPPKINGYIREELLRYGLSDLSTEEYEALWKSENKSTFNQS